MSSIPENSSTGMLPRFNQGLGQTGFSNKVQKSSLNAYEQLAAGLTIQTREGDVVTLSSNSFFEFSSFEYNSQGILQSDNNIAQVNQHYRQIELTTGESFSFSVQGDLNEQELADIDAIIKGIDGIINEVATGDMEDAVSMAMSMGSYDSVSMYSADIAYSRGYSMAEQTRSEYMGALAGADLPDTDLPDTELEKLAAGRNSYNNLWQHGSPDNFLEKMVKKLEEKQEKLMEKAQQPIDSLFRHHLSKIKDKEKPQTPEYSFLENARKKLDQMISDMVKNSFGNHLNKVF